jgi:hypothetical protein
LDAEQIIEERAVATQCNAHVFRRDAVVAAPLTLRFARFGGESVGQLGKASD